MSTGLEIGMRGVTLEAAAKASKMPRASVYRAWKRDSPGSPGPQQEFQTAVAVQILSGHVMEQAGIYDPVLEMLGELTAKKEPLEIAAGIAAMTEPQRMNAFARTLAVGTIANIASLRGNTLFHTQAGLLASLNTQHEPAESMMDAMVAGEAGSEVRWVELYQFVFAIFGMRMKPHYKYEHLALAGVALSTGLGSRQFSEHLEGITRPVVDPDTGHKVIDDTVWNLFGAASMGLVSEFCEADPESTHPTNPSDC